MQKPLRLLALILFAPLSHKVYSLTIYFYRHKSKISSSIIDPKRDFAAGVSLSEAPFPTRFLFEAWSSDFVGSESGSIQSVKLLQNMVSNRTQHDWLYLRSINSDKLMVQNPLHVNFFRWLHFAFVFIQLITLRVYCIPSIWYILYSVHIYNWLLWNRVINR